MAKQGLRIWGGVAVSIPLEEFVFVSPH